MESTVECAVRRWGSLVLGWTAASWWSLTLTYPSGSGNEAMDSALRLAARDLRWSMIGLAALGFVWLRGGRWSAVGWAAVGAGGWYALDGWAERSGISGPVAAIALAGFVGLAGTAVWLRAGVAAGPVRPAVLIWCALLAACLGIAGQFTGVVVSELSRLDMSRDLDSAAAPLVDVTSPLGELASLPVALVLGLGLGLGAVLTAARRPVRPRGTMFAAAVVVIAAVGARWLPQPLWPGPVGWYVAMLWKYGPLVALCVVTTVLVGPRRHPTARLATAAMLAVVVPLVANPVGVLDYLMAAIQWPAWWFDLRMTGFHPTPLNLIGGALLAWLFTWTGPISRRLTGLPAASAGPTGPTDGAADPAPDPPAER